MTVVWILLVGVIAGALYYGYLRLQQIERELREEMAATARQKTREQPLQGGGKPKPEPKPEPKPVKKGKGTKVKASPEGGGPSASATLKEQVVEVVAGNPGMKQVELYEGFPKENRRKLQQVLQSLAAEGRIRREPEKNSYRLFPQG